MSRCSSQDWTLRAPTMWAVTFYWCQFEDLVHFQAISVSILPILLLSPALLPVFLGGKVKEKHEKNIHFEWALIFWIIVVMTHRPWWITETHFIVYIADCTGNVRLQFVRKADTDLVQIKKLVIRIKVADGSLRLHNLFNGDKLLGMRTWNFFVKIDQESKK